jgi:hypothetical protein
MKPVDRIEGEGEAGQLGPGDVAARPRRPGLSSFEGDPRALRQPTGLEQTQIARAGAG